jgi:hypothetical protein
VNVSETFNILGDFMKKYFILLMILPLFLAIGCSRGAIGGAAVGAGAAGRLMNIRTRWHLKILKMTGKQDVFPKTSIFDERKKLRRDHLFINSTQGLWIICL